MTRTSESKEDSLSGCQKLIDLIDEPFICLQAHAHKGTRQTGSSCNESTFPKSAMIQQRVNDPEAMITKEALTTRGEHPD